MEYIKDCVWRQYIKQLKLIIARLIHRKYIDFLKTLDKRTLSSLFRKRESDERRPKQTL